MHIHWLDQYQSGQSLIHRLDVRVKLLLTVAYVLAASLMPVGAWSAYGLLFIFALVGARVSGLGVARVQRRALVALPFALAAITTIFSTPGPIAFSFSLGPWQLQVSEPGLIRFFSIMLKSWLSVQAAVLLAGTTPFPALMTGMRSLRFPPILVAIISFMWRYIFVLADEVMRLSRARDARSAVRPGFKSGGRLSWRARVVGAMAGNLFIRSYGRSERVYQAMMARGYEGELRTLTPPHLHTRDVWLGLVLGGYLAVALLAGVVLH